MTMTQKSIGTICVPFVARRLSYSERYTSAGEVKNRDLKNFKNEKTRLNRANASECVGVDKSQEIRIYLIVTNFHVSVV